VLTAAIAITVVYIPQYFRVVRNTGALGAGRSRTSKRGRRRLGARPRTVMRRYVFANVVHSVPVVASLNAADAILTLAALSFLGIGMDPSVAAEWGYDISPRGRGCSSRVLVDRLFPGLAVIPPRHRPYARLGEGINDTFNATPAPAEPPPVRHAQGCPGGHHAAVEMERPVVRVRDLRVGTRRTGARYARRRRVSFDESRERARRCCGMVGESGQCAESTLGRGLIGLLPVGAIRDGSVDFEGRDLVKATQQEMRQSSGALDRPCLPGAHDPTRPAHADLGSLRRGPAHPRA